MSRQRRDPGSEDKPQSQSAAVVDHRLKTWHEIPSWQQDNEYILSGYRPATGSYGRCFQSLKYIHNETINIYSHIFGTILFLTLPVLTYQTLYHRYSHASQSDIIVFSTFFYGVSICFALSATYHIITTHSPKVQKFGNQLDYLGIVILMWGSTIPSVYYGFYCHPNLQKAYCINVSVLALFCVIATLHPNFRHPTIRPYRAAMYSALGLSAVVFITHGIWLDGWEIMRRRMSVDWMASMAGFNLVGAVVYAARVCTNFCYYTSRPFFTICFIDVMHRFRRN